MGRRRRERRPVLALLAQPHPLATHEPFRSSHHTKGKPMTPDQIRRSWDDDDTPRSVFPEPLAERLTRENKELREEIERLRGIRDSALAAWHEAASDRDFATLDSESAEARLDALVADLRGLADGWDAQGPHTWMWTSNAVDMVRAVLDKHAGEQP
jgi:hypothetical protein